jgi:uncharacterized protein (TIGR02145 family)
MNLLMNGTAMNRACFFSNTNLHEQNQHASSIRPIKNNFVLMKRVTLIASAIYCFLLTGLQAQTVTDVEGNVYKTVKIAAQVWMNENLKTTRYNDGTAIPEVTENRVWSALTAGSYCNYENTPANSTRYGKLYNYYTVNTGKLCPAGWHVPSDVEWAALAVYLGGLGVAGSKLKETGTTHWLSLTTNTEATNETGFTALPGGYRDVEGVYYSVGYDGKWWSSTETSMTNATLRLMSSNSTSLGSGTRHKRTALSVRCLLTL